MIVQKILQLRMAWWWWVMSIYAVHLNVYYGVSFIIYLVILVPILVRLNYLSVQYRDNRMKDLALAVLLALGLAASIFPGYSINFLFVGGRSGFVSSLELAKGFMVAGSISGEKINL